MAQLYQNLLRFLTRIFHGAGRYQDPPVVIGEHPFGPRLSTVHGDGAGPDAIHRATTNGFGLIEPTLDTTHAELRRLARYRREQVRRNATLRSQIHAELDGLLPGFSAAIVNTFDHEAALEIARRVTSADQIRTLGVDGLGKLLAEKGVRYQGRSLEDHRLGRSGAGADRGLSSDHTSDFHLSR
jgi:hypothetical protein